MAKAKQVKILRPLNGLEDEEAFIKRVNVVAKEYKATGLRFYPETNNDWAKAVLTYEVKA